REGADRQARGQSRNRDRTRGARHRKTQSPVELLELLARSAAAGLVAARQLLRGACRLTVAAHPRGRGRPATGLGLGLRLLGLLRLLGGPDGDAKDGLRDAARDPRRHLLVEGVRLTLVRDEWVLLSVPPCIDPFASIFHRGKIRNKER